jgi:hypothetical protein
MTSKAFGLAQLGNVYADGALSNRNLIINGAMQVAQRGTSVTGVTTVGYYTADRMRTSLSSAGGVVLSQSVVSDQNVGDFIANALKNEVTTAAAAGQVGYNYRVETNDVSPYVGQTMTLSFYMKADAAVDIFPIIVGDTTINPSAITLTTSYVRYVVTFTMPSVATVNRLDIILRADATVATANYITGVQLEAGDTATPFEHRSYGQELALCQRYYETSYPLGFSAGHNFGQEYPFGTSKPVAVNLIASDDTVVSQTIRFAVQKRASPTVVIYSAKDGTTGVAWTYKGSGGTNLNWGANVTYTSQDLWNINQGLSAVNQANEAYFHFTASAEL